MAGGPLRQFTTSSALIGLIGLIAVLCTFSSEVQSAPTVGGTETSPVVYRRYVRRRPSDYLNDLYMDEFMEVFHTRRRPPVRMLSDEEVDLIIRCDFEPTLEECEKLLNGGSLTTTFNPTSRTVTTSARPTPASPPTSAEDLPFLPDLEEVLDGAEIADQEADGDIGEDYTDVYDGDGSNSWW